MKRILITVFAVVVVGAASLYLFREPLFEALAARLTADMFVTEDLDGFDPGPAVGSALPALMARHGDSTVTGIEAFMGPRGLIFVASRSIEW